MKDALVVRNEKPSTNITVGSPFFQAKLHINQPDDIHEREADVMADRVVREQTVDTKNLFFQPVKPTLISRKCPSCEDEEIQQRKEDKTKEEESEPITGFVQRKCKACEEEENAQIQRKEKNRGDVNLSLVSEVIQSRGQALDSDTKQFMETRFGRDFSEIQIHNDTKAHRSAQDINARAYTHRNHIVFGEGEYNPNTQDGKKLIAHELTHTIQQGNSIQPKLIQRNALTEFVGNAWGASGGRAVNYIGDQIGDAIDYGEEQLTSVINYLAPGLLDFLRGDIIGILKDKLLTYIDSSFGGLISRIQVNGLAEVLQELFSTVLTGISEGMIGGCRAVAASAEKVFNFIKHLGGAALQRCRAFFNGLANQCTFIWNEYAKPALDFIKKYAGEAWDWVSDKARWIWEVTRPLREASTELITRAWNRVKQWFNIQWNNAVNLFDEYKNKIITAWNEIKGYIEPIMPVILALGATILLFSPVGPILVATAAGVGLWYSLEWLAKNWDSHIIGPMMQFLNDNIFPTLNRLHLLVANAFQTAMNWIADIFTRISNAAHRLYEIAVSTSLFITISNTLKRGSDFIKIQLDSILSYVRPIASRFRTRVISIWNILRPLAELIRQLLLIVFIGPLSILDDGVWNTLNFIVAKCLEIPCLREITQLLRIPTLMTYLGKFRIMMKQAWEIMLNPQPIIDEIKLFIEEQIDKIAPNAKSKLFQLAANTGLHLNILWDNYLSGMLTHIKDDWWNVVKTAIWEQLWPFEGLTTMSAAPSARTGLGKEIGDLFMHSGEAIRRFVRLDFEGSLENFLLALHNVTAIANRFYGWIALVIIMSETVMGAVGGAAAGGAGAIPGALAGFGAGMASAGTLGLYFLGATFVVDGLVLLNSIRLLHPVLEALEDEIKMRENDERYKRIAESTLMLGMMLAFLAIAAVGGKIASAFASRLSKFLPKDIRILIQNLRRYVEMGMRGERPILARGGPAYEGMPRLRTSERIPSSAHPEPILSERLPSSHAEPLPSERLPSELPNELRPADAAPYGPAVRERIPDAEVPPENIPPEGLTDRTGDSPAPEAYDGIGGDMRRLRERVNNPENIRPETDPNFSRDYDARVEVEGHTFRRDRRTGRWCRFSNELCNIESQPEINAAVDEVVPRSEGTPEPTAEVPAEVRPKAWDDATLTLDEFISSYRLRYPNSRLTNAELRVYFNENYRLNPETGALRRPISPSEAAPRESLPVAGSPEYARWSDYRFGDVNSPLCFEEGTQVKTPEGYCSIENLKVGQKVLSYNFESKSVNHSKVVTVYNNWTNMIYEIRLGKNTIRSTKNHPFWIEEEEKWYPACLLRVGMNLLNTNNELLPIISINIETINVNTFNIECVPNHNYYVGIDGILVHNDEHVSRFATVETYPSDIYVIKHNERVIYVGQTQMAGGAELRITDGHMRYPDSAVYRYLQSQGIDPSSPGFDYRAYLEVETPIRQRRMTPFEITMWEQRYIDANGGIGNLENRINAITRESYLQYRNLHNPC